MKALVVALVLLAGCDAAPGAQRLVSGGTLADVQELRLSDGTRCVVMQGPQRGGITCEWRRP